MNQPVTGDHLRATLAVSQTTLLPLADRDWSVLAGDMTWTCRQTLDHLCDAIGFYCGQIATRSSGPRTKFRNGDLQSSLDGLLTALETGCQMLATIAAATPPDLRFYHRMGMADAEGFLAMGCGEVLGHTWDIATGLGEVFTVPEAIAAPVVHRLFPWAPTDCTRAEAFLWCADRIALPNRPRIGRWGVFAPPLSEWTGGTTPHAVWPIQ